MKTAVCKDWISHKQKSSIYIGLLLLPRDD